MLSGDKARYLSWRKEALMKIGIIIFSSDPETVWNAFRYGNFALTEKDKVKVFLIGKGVEAESPDTENLWLRSR